MATWAECDRALVSQIFEVDVHTPLYRKLQKKTATQKKAELIGL